MLSTGSERLSKSGAVGAHMVEASSINKGLFFLGQVIDALTARTNHSADIIVPYRSAGAAWSSRETSSLLLLLPAGLRRPVMAQQSLILASAHACSSCVASVRQSPHLVGCQGADLHPQADGLQEWQQPAYPALRHGLGCCSRVAGTTF